MGYDLTMDMRYTIGQTLIQRCDDCEDNFAYFQVQKSIGGNWFAYCEKCSKMIKLEQQLEK